MALEPIVLHVFPGIRPGGGPAGYGYNLQMGLQGFFKNEKDAPLWILSPTGSSYGIYAEPSWRFRLLQKVPIWLAAQLLFLRYRQVCNDIFRYFGFSAGDLDRMRSVKVIVFHDWRLAKTYLHKIGRQPGQRILAMPHSPTEHSAEVIENWRACFGCSQAWQRIYEYLSAMEIQTLLSCDGLVVPCYQSLESYFVTHPERQASLLNLPIYQIKSGVSAKEATLARRQVLCELGIPYEKKIVGFFGRHHSHKGYDLFCEVARLVYEEKDSDLFFLTAGSGPVPSPTDLANFIDLGHLAPQQCTNMMAAADLIVVPNRFNYFDLVILEAMSLGKVVLTTPVGGALCLKAPGIFMIKNKSPKLLLEEIRYIVFGGRGPLSDLGMGNRDVFLQEYTLECFVRNHITLAQDLLSENKIWGI